MDREKALMNFRKAVERVNARKQEVAAIINGDDDRCDVAACRRILLNKTSVEDAIGVLSTSEAIAVALAFGRLDLCPEGHQNFRSAWQRLDDRQRRLVDLVATADWSEGSLSSV